MNQYLLPILLLSFALFATPKTKDPLVGSWHTVVFGEQLTITLNSNHTAHTQDQSGTNEALNGTWGNPKKNILIIKGFEKKPLNFIYVIDHNKLHLISPDQPYIVLFRDQKEINEIIDFHKGLGKDTKLTTLISTNRPRPTAFMNPLGSGSPINALIYLTQYYKLTPQMAANLADNTPITLRPALIFNQHLYHSLIAKTCPSPLAQKQRKGGDQKLCHRAFQKVDFKKAILGRDRFLLALLCSIKDLTKKKCIHYFPESFIKPINWKEVFPKKDFDQGKNQDIHNLIGTWHTVLVGAPIQFKINSDGSLITRGEKGSWKVIKPGYITLENDHHIKTFRYQRLKNTLHLYSKTEPYMFFQKDAKIIDATLALLKKTEKTSLMTLTSEHNSMNAVFPKKGKKEAINALIETLKNYKHLDGTILKKRINQIPYLYRPSFIFHKNLYHAITTRICKETLNHLSEHDKLWCWYTSQNFKKGYIKDELKHYISILEWIIQK